MLNIHKECGQSFTSSNVQRSNLKIVGGKVATQGSWPSIAYLVWNYKGNFTLPTGVNVTVTRRSFCDGTLISTRKVLTAAHCIPTTISYMYANVTYTSQVYSNTYYPTIASTLTVYLGAHDISLFKNDTVTPPAVKMAVLDVRKVITLKIVHLR